MKKYYLGLMLILAAVMVGCVGQIKTLADVVALSAKNTNYKYQQIDPANPSESTEIFFKDGKVKIKSPIGDTYIDQAANRLYAGSSQEALQNIFIFSDIPTQLQEFLKYNLVIPVNQLDISKTYLKKEKIGDKDTFVFELLDAQEEYDYTTTVWFWDENGLPVQFRITNNTTGNSIDIQVQNIEFGVVTDDDVTVPATARLLDSTQAIPEDLINNNQ
ncbi:MAG: hypothetical protein HUU49_03945 [Candidatus Buchananbacteria bacterium]|nr:hypothetical protein [Candidatus Buchananbacteria bacterium]